MALRIALVAGETSGDTLGAALIEALRRRFPERGIRRRGGPENARRRLRGLARHRRALRHGAHRSDGAPAAPDAAARHLRRQILDWRPDVFIGVDYKEFNLGLARQLKRAGLTTVQYVSPQVWAWRQGRVRTIGESVDLVLCLFPFEPDFYREHGVRAAFVGHPLADQIPLEVDRDAARAELGIAPERACSRCCPAAGVAKWTSLRSFAGAAELLARAYPGLVSSRPW